MNSYLLLEKQRFPSLSGRPPQWDVLISSFNSSDRVRLMFEKVRARDKYWLILPEYGFDRADYPAGNSFDAPSGTEADLLNAFIGSLPEGLADKRVVIDITGFIGHYVLALVAVLEHLGIKEYDVIYGEPVRYTKSERTRFSDETVLEVRQVCGFEGVHSIETNDDLLILAVGYDSRLVAEVASNKEHTKKIQLFGLPSLRPDMYQESLLCAARVAEAVGPDASLPQHFKYAPANDPFVTASVLSMLVEEHRSRYRQANVYLSPLSTKAQTLGFALFYQKECMNTATSIVYPFCKRYSKETSEGLANGWLYHVER